MSVRHEVKKLIKLEKPDYEDSDDEQEDAPGAGLSSASKTPPTATSTSEGISAVEDCEPQTGSRIPSEYEHSLQERFELVQIMLQNWPPFIRQYLPRHAYPISTRVLLWPFRLLEALLGFSSATRGRSPEDVRASLEPAFASADKFSLKKFLRIIADLRSSLVSNAGPLGDQNMKQTSPAPAVRPDVDNQGILKADGESTATTLPTQPAAQTSEAPQQAGKRRSSRHVTPEGDTRDQKKPKHAQDGEARFTALFQTDPTHHKPTSTV
ncbi:uncharacterized protein M421DRAFT_8174 [Didymella exigua CBS 183.55]|uniref:Uncharacterized protein n=1 Tax=Didymella exigua CBS 183.55 TaxID=1150837 RepID=A0A6A5RCH9_9PLEO|nr:uncharacterized protein M421DRAFT_8174 [Didymella exigua CBS 183.55]KAF1925089.1 hypothetical protein M421DRAFT_8174 [Didymella exigua CBS 183.55]